MSAKLIARLLCTCIYPVLFLAISGDWYWIEGALFMFTIIAASCAISAYLYLKDPQLLQERLKTSSTDQVPIDRMLFKLVSILFILWFLSVPIDVKRYEWSTGLIAFNAAHPGYKWLAYLLTFPGLYLFCRSFYDCTYLSPVLRIQKERKQLVIDTGSFGIIRHPMYSGLCQWLFFSAIFLSSFAGILVAVLIVITFWIRIKYEEEMLEKELDGYIRYKQRVQYKLIPYLV